MNFLNNKDTLGNAFILVFSTIYLITTFDIPINIAPSYDVVNARTLPYCLAAIAILISLFSIFTSVNNNEDEEKTSVLISVRNFRWRPCLSLIALMLAYSLIFDFLGFILSTFIFLFSGFLILKERRKFFGALISLAVVVFMWTVLTQLFGIYLSPGELYTQMFGG